MPGSLEDSIARSWAVPFWPTCFLILTFAVYLRGWYLAQQTRAAELPSWRIWSFGSGLLAFWLAIASPLDAISSFLFSAHMAQHIILLSVAPPLIVLGAPTVPLLRGVPKIFTKEIVAPWASLPLLGKLSHVAMHPALAWILANGSLVAWHLPPAYELTLRSNMWHEVEHSCFFFTSILFWWKIIEPWPSRPTYSRWMIVPYILGSAIVNSALCAALTFSDHVIYHSYAMVPRLYGISALQDQVAGGLGMWVIGSAFLLGPAMLFVFQLLSPAKRRQQTFVILGQNKTVRPFDLLQVPGIGAVLRSRYGRMSLQAVSFTVMAVTFADGFWGHQMGSMNLAGILPWNVIRVFGVLILLFAGNLFCMACPFTLPREMARWFVHPRWKWPAFLHKKWIGAVLMLLFFWAYEQWALWDVPKRTAMILSAYVLTAFVVDSLFEKASFCKYICPVGQVNFMGSLLSPLELGAKSQSVCHSCQTRDCIRGNATQRGCELDLYIPQKVGNLDCTLCMDCVKACPHDNIQIAVQNPWVELIQDRPRSSFGRLSTRWDIGAVALVVSLGSFAAAGVMVSPVVNGLGELQANGGFLSLLFSPANSILCFVIALSCMALGFAYLSRALASIKEHSARELFCRFSLALLPLGMTMWAAHLLFHLNGGVPSLLPAVQQASGFLVAHHTSLHAYPLGIPNWAVASLVTTDTMQQCQLVLLGIGVLISLYVGWRIAVQLTQGSRQALLLWGAWASTNLMLYALGIWILVQPMEMRGMVMS